jgi:phosphonate transport system substrate-binding protein
MVDRRSFLKGAGAASTVGITGLSGCLGDDGTGTPQGMTFGGDKEINFGISPSVPQEDLEVQYGPLTDHLGSYVKENYDVPDGLSVSSSIGSNYSAVIQSLGQGTTDVAETGPFAGALGVKTGNAEVILQRFGYGSWEYKSIIAVPKDSDISELSDLSGKTVSFSDQLSTSGALYPLYSISKEGGLDIGGLPDTNGAKAEFDARFAGGHASSYTLLKEGQVDAAAMGGFIRDTGAGPSTEEFKNTAKTLHEDSGLPRAPIVVSPELGSEEKDAIKQAFLEAPDEVYLGQDGEEDTEENKPDDDLWFSKVREADKSRYQSVIDVANELGVGKDIFKS